MRFRCANSISTYFRSRCGAGGIACFFIEAAWNFPLRRLRAALWCQEAAAAVVDACEIGRQIVVADAARCRQIAAGDTHLAIALPVIAEVFAREGSSCAAVSIARKELNSQQLPATSGKPFGLTF